MRDFKMINDISNKLVSSSHSIQTKPVKVESVKLEAVKPVKVTDEKVITEKPTDDVVQNAPLVNAENIDTAVNHLNNIVQNIERDLNFRVDDKSGKTIVTVLDSKTEEVIRQIPAEHVLAISENIENLKGILFSAKV